MTGRNQNAVKKTAAGLLKLLFPHRREPAQLLAYEIKFILELAIEMRKRVTDQLDVILPTEYSDVLYTCNLKG